MKTTLLAIAVLLTIAACSHIDWSEQNRICAENVRACE